MTVSRSGTPAPVPRGLFRLGRDQKQSRFGRGGCRHVSLASVLAVAFLGVLPPAASASKQQMFGILFPELPGYDAPSDAALTALTAGETATAVGPMFDTNLPADDNPARLPAFFTYFGQFVDHDLTLDTLALPNSFVDPTTLPNGRDQRLNLDSVYGLKSQFASQLYEADGQHLKVNDRDLPRNPDGSAILIEGRNDENQVIAQIHVAFLRAHNNLIDQGYKLKDARQLMEWRYQWIIVHEFLAETLDPTVYQDAFRPNGAIVTRYFDPKKAEKGYMPVEFSVAAYRFGHSQVRRAYRIVQGGGLVQVFDNPPVDDLRGGRPISATHTIFWPNFLNVDGMTPTGVNGAPTNISRKLDTLLSRGLFRLPIPGAADSGPSILALRNLQRAREYGVPSGQAVAARLGLPVLTNAQIVTAIPRLAMLTTDASFLGEAPLWLYILAESNIVHNGARLGPVASRLVAEVFGRFLAGDKTSYYRQGWAPPGGVYRMQDLLRDAGALPAVP